ncbi:MAG: hypothetical protein VXZ56_00910, partial [Bacteroidota bacterium]|nr:hypothetical protein [Bacteroidota bacterium]
MTPSPQADGLQWRRIWSFGLAWMACAIVTSLHAQTQSDTTFNLPFPHDNGDMFNPTEFPGGVSLQWPSNFNYGVVYNPLTGMYEVQQTIGDTLEFRPSSLFTLDEYLNYNIEGNLTEFWNELQEEEDEA